MALMMSSLYDALREGGTTDEMARTAAVEVANYGNRFGKVEAKLDLLQWMVGFNIALSVAILFKVFS